MERIVIEVDDDVAKKWRTSSQARKVKLSQEVNLRLAKSLSQSHEEFMLFLDELGKKAEERGLTEEILTEILKGDEKGFHLRYQQSYQRISPARFH